LLLNEFVLTLEQASRLSLRSFGRQANPSGFLLRLGSVPDEAE
jgi:hypothetical protein